MAGTKINYWKLGVIAAAIVAIFLLGRGCGIRSVITTKRSDTVIKTDTFYSAINIPIPVNVIYTKDSLVLQEKIKWLEKWDTLWKEVAIEPIPEQIAADLKDYFTTRFYDSTYKFNRGTARLKDTVFKNRLTGRSVEFITSDTTIVNTIKLTPPRRIVGYFTTSFGGNMRQPLYMVGLGLGLKLPNDRVYQAEYKFVQGHRPMIEGRIFFPIRLMKKFPFNGNNNR